MPRFSPLWLALACAAGAMPPPIHAAPAVWRCGNSYSDIPCDGGHAIDAASKDPSVEQRRRADEGTRRDQAAADRMQRERLGLEAQPRQGVIIGKTDPSSATATPNEPKADSSGKKKSKGTRPKKPDAFVASYSTPGDAPTTKKKKAAPKAASNTN